LGNRCVPGNDGPAGQLGLPPYFQTPSISRGSGCRGRKLRERGRGQWAILGKGLQANTYPSGIPYQALDHPTYTAKGLQMTGSMNTVWPSRTLLSTNQHLRMNRP